MLCWSGKSLGCRECSTRKVSWGGKGGLSLGKEVRSDCSTGCEEESDNNHTGEDPIVGQGPNSWDRQLLGVRACHVPACMLPHPHPSHHRRHRARSWSQDILAPAADADCLFLPLAQAKGQHMVLLIQVHRQLSCISVPSKA